MKNLALPSSTEAGGGGAKYREITEHLRKLISSGELKPGTRLPSIKVLAKEWDTNYFTVQSALTPLANEGLIERTPRRGTFVRERLARLSSVGCYFGGNLWSDTEGAFYQKTYGEVQRLCFERNIRCDLYIDNRAPNEQESALAELAKSAQNRNIQGIIGMMLNPEYTWLEDLKIPLALLKGSGIHADAVNVFALALDRLAADGCRKVGYLARPYLEHRHLFLEMALARGLQCEPAWCASPTESWGPSGELYAYRSFKQLWSQQDRPEGLFVQSDWECRGAITAILELGVRVPQNLHLVLYRNSSVNYVCPWNVPAIVLNTTEVAATFIDYIETQHRTEKLDQPPPFLKVKLLDPS